MAIAGRSMLFDQVPNVYTVARDPKGSKYVNLAIAARAEYLITWDKHLLELMDADSPFAAELHNLYPSLRILDPVAFVREIEP